MRPVAQEGFLLLWNSWEIGEAIPQPAGPGSCVARNLAEDTARSSFRRAERDSPPEQLMASMGREPPADHRLEREECLPASAARIAELPDRIGAVLDLRAIFFDSYAQTIAGMLGNQ